MKQTTTTLAAIHRCRPAYLIACLIAGDILALALSGAITIVLKLWFTGHLESWQLYVRLIPLLPVFLLVYASIGLYSGVSLGSPEELRRLTLSSTLVSILLAVSTLSLRGTGTVFTYTMAAALLLSMILVPLERAWLRLKLADVSWWGYPAVIFGDQESAAAIIDNLMQDPGLGLKPVGCLSPAPAGADIQGVPVIDERELGTLAQSIRGPAYALLTASSASSPELMYHVNRYRKHFTHIAVVPEVAGFSCLWVNPRNLGGTLVLEMHQQVFVPSRQHLKRFIDIVLTIGIAVIAAPLLIGIALAIRLDSKGPVLYGHRRIGRGGHEFMAWKFRTMVPDAPAVLERFLAENPAMRAEWERNFKLKRDPRITRVGHFLRRTSLDELPQLWNVSCGEMSLVGPRPIVRDEIARYGADYEAYTWVPSGLTGLWQVSGRSETSYQQRIAFDRFYVNNWSVWLDLCILFRTIGAVLSRAGAV
jgi:Undecaprenyl-phosphate galactose phosphotransferase WbaP